MAQVGTVPAHPRTHGGRGVHPDYGWILIAVGQPSSAALPGWLRLTSAERLMRIAVIAIVIVAAVTRANPRTGA